MKQPSSLRVLLLSVLICVSTALPAVEKLRVLALFADKVMVEIDGKRHLLKEGEASPEGVVLISADAQGAVMEVDGKRESYGLGAHVDSSYAQPEVKEAKIWRDATGSFSTIGSINGRTVSMLVDTGATTVAMSEREAQRLGIPYQRKGEQTGVNTASGFSQAWSVPLDEVRVGDIRLRNVPAVVIRGDSPLQVLLGMSFLGRLDMENQGSVMVLSTRR